MSSTLRFLAGASLLGCAWAGPFPPAAGVAGSDAIPANDSRFSFWAADATLTRGLVDITFPEGAYASYGSESAALGPADATPDSPYPVVSLGDGGTIDLTFPVPIQDIPGPDFAVFENGFTSSFLELAHVEVSSDGIHFHRFPSTSLTPITGDLGEGGAVEPSDIRNLAGKYLAGYGTPFDLAELKTLHPDLDLQRITHVRLIDVVGSSNPEYATRDAAGRIIVDPFPTAYPSAGFDLDAVGAFKSTTTTFATWVASQGLSGNEAGITADPDHDGVPNLLAYLTGGRGLRIAKEESATTLHFSRRSYRADGKLKVEGSNDLVAWTPLAVSTGGAAVQSTGAALVQESGESLVDVSVSLADGAYRFFRLAAETEP